MSDNLLTPVTWKPGTYTNPSGGRSRSGSYVVVVVVVASELCVIEPPGPFPVAIVRPYVVRAYTICLV